MDLKEGSIRQRLEEREEFLSPYAVKSINSKGRSMPELACPVRTEFQRDRDRIIHCKAFRRLKHKTQVFIAPMGDHYVTRLTHTLEVSQIARTISRSLDLNEDLTEAIALGHDLGHTPFGHVGEEVLNEITSSGFRHNAQSLRVVDLLENEGHGLNLTWEVRDGILKHSKTKSDILGAEWGAVATLEGQVCKIADIIAYINHDVGDAIRAGIITEGNLPRVAVRVLGATHSERVKSMVFDVINRSQRAIENEVPLINMSDSVREAASRMREFLFKNVYEPISAKDDSARAKEAVRLLFNYLIRHEDIMPPGYALHADTVERRAIDYIAGMTDQFALRMAENIRNA